MIRYEALLRALVQGSVLMQNLTQGKPVGGTAVISFRLTPSGHLLSARVTQGGGDAVVNRAALKAVMGTRFPPFIRNMPMHPMTFSVSVNLSLYAGNAAPGTGLQPVYRQPLPMVHPGGSSFMSRAIRRSDMHCLAGVPLHAPWTSPSPVSTTVVSFVSRMEAVRDIARNNRALHGMTDPRYLRNQRVLLHPDGSPAGVTMLALVPVGMRVIIGEDVQMDQFHASHRAPCIYVPNMIEK
ncbi:TonB family protein [Acidithiobacillus sp. GGI-221]|nr:TonB family protein [Acidithiobacillus sp. GGI-221]